MGIENELPAGTATERLTGVEVTYQVDGTRMLVMYPDSTTRSYAYSTFQSQFKLPQRRTRALYVSPSDLVKRGEFPNSFLKDQILQSEHFPKSFDNINYLEMCKALCAEIPVEEPSTESIAAIERNIVAFYNEFQATQTAVSRYLSSYHFYQKKYYDENELNVLSKLESTQDQLKSAIAQVAICYIRAVAYSRAYVAATEARIKDIRDLNAINECGFVIASINQKGMF